MFVDLLGEEVASCTPSCLVLRDDSILSFDSEFPDTVDDISCNVRVIWVCWRYEGVCVVFCEDVVFLLQCFHPFVSVLMVLKLLVVLWCLLLEGGGYFEGFFLSKVTVRVEDGLRWFTLAGASF